MPPFSPIPRSAAISGTAPIPLEEARRGANAVVKFDQFRPRFGLWAIQDRATGEIHGWTELSKLRPWSGPSDEIALSYVLRQASWHQGIATEAAGRLLQHGFEILELDRVMALVKAGNVRSERVLAKLGFYLVQDLNPEAHPNLHFFRIDAPSVLAIPENLRRP